jgi:hypothetical protein
VPPVEKETVDARRNKEVVPGDGGAGERKGEKLDTMFFSCLSLSLARAARSKKTRIDDANAAATTSRRTLSFLQRWCILITSASNTLGEK